MTKRRLQEKREMRALFLGLISLAVVAGVIAGKVVWDAAANAPVVLGEGSPITTP
jgi:uncharacterized membrane protein